MAYQALVSAERGQGLAVCQALEEDVNELVLSAKKYSASQYETGSASDGCVWGTPSRGRLTLTQMSTEI
jgi:hypothetical protein